MTRTAMKAGPARLTSRLPCEAQSSAQIRMRAVQCGTPIHACRFHFLALRAAPRRASSADGVSRWMAYMAGFQRNSKSSNALPTALFSLLCAALDNVAFHTQSTTNRSTTSNLDERRRNNLVLSGQMRMTLLAHRASMRLVRPVIWNHMTSCHMT